MTTTNVEVKELPKPGTIVFVRGLIYADDGLFGLTTTREFFEENASKRAVKVFNNSSVYTLVPVMVMLENFAWDICFRQRHHVKPLDSLLDDKVILEECLRRISYFTHRDGSKYYSKFHKDLHYYLNFINGKFPCSKVENLLERRFVEHLIEWREEQKPKPESVAYVMSKTLELAQSQLGGSKNL